MQVRALHAQVPELRLDRGAEALGRNAAQAAQLAAGGVELAGELVQAAVQRAGVLLLPGELVDLLLASSQ